MMGFCGRDGGLGCNGGRVEISGLKTEKLERNQNKNTTLHSISEVL